MMTELQNNFELIKDRMVAKYMGEKEHLFFYPPCIIPAWEPLIDEMIELIEEYNESSEDKLRFFQIKEKFGTLTVYLDWNDSKEEDKLREFPPVPDHIRNAVNTIASNGHKICRKCGERKVQTVVESRLQWKCLDHWEGDSRWGVRE